MAKLTRDDSGRYQNTSHLLVSVLKKDHAGQLKSKALRPGQIITMTDDEVEASKDVHEKRESNPIDRKLVQRIPEGKSEHPDKPDLGRHANMRAMEEHLIAGEFEPAIKMIEAIGDIAGITKVRRLVSIKEDDLKKDVVVKVSDAVDKQQEAIDRRNEKLQRQYEDVN